jgi:hypothetical protein
LKDSNVFGLVFFVIPLCIVFMVLYAIGTQPAHVSCISTDGLKTYEGEAGSHRIQFRRWDISPIEGERFIWEGYCDSHGLE